jgi:hypothetical protein
MQEFKFPDEADNKPEVNEEEQIEVVTDEAPEIEVVDDTPEKDRGRRPLERDVADPTDDELQSYSEGVKKRIKELTHARHDERRKAEALAREKQELERIARAMMEENQKLKKYVSTGEQEYAKVAATAAERELEDARRKLKAAHEAFDTDAIIAAQEELADAKMKVERAKNFKPAPLQEEAKEVQIPDSTSERPQIDDKTLRWQAKNQWFGAPGYEDMTSFSLGLHQKLVNSGVDPRSDDYFEQIDARLRKTFPEHFGVEEEVKPEPSRKPATVVAPAARSTGAKKIKLTTTQIALAEKLGLTPQQYAMEMAKLEKQNG